MEFYAYHNSGDKWQMVNVNIFYTCSVNELESIKYLFLI